MPRWEAASISITSSDVAVRDRLGDRGAGVEVGVRAALGVQRLGEDAGHRGLARPARAGEQVGLTHLAVLDRVAQGPHDRLLADHMAEVERAIRAIQGGHEAILFAARSLPGGITVPGRALRRRNGLPRRNLRRRLGPGGTAAPGRESLALLPSGPDAVRTLPVRGTRPVNTSCADPIPMKPSLRRHSVPLERISGSGNRYLPT